MKTKNMFWAALSMTAAFVMTACSSNDDNNRTETPVAPPTSTTTTIPYTVTVSGDDATTRATVDDNNKTLRFAAGDKLYITGTNIKGVLNITDGVGSATGATFSGDLTYSGSGNPASTLPLTATLVSAQQTVDTQVFVDDYGAVTVNYPTAAYCTNVNDAVQKYSNLMGVSTYGAKTFSLSQQTAFLNFVITFDDGTTSGTELSAVVSNNGSDICTANVTTTTENNNVVAKFVLPVASGITLTGPTVKMGDKNAISFIGATLSPKVYNVKRTQLNPNAISGKFTVNNSGKQVYFSKGNLRANYNNSSWSWSFAPYQWNHVGNNSANTNITGNGTVDVGGYVYVDLFGWSTSKTYLGIHKSTDNSAYEGTFSDWGKHSDVIAGIGSGWRTLTGGEWDYLFTARETTSGKHYCKAKVNGVFGVILLPDDWSTSYYSLESLDIANLSFSDGAIPENNKISSEVWNASFVPHGAVFLPTTGQRAGTSVTNENGRLYYWSATKGSSTGTDANANQMYIAGNAVSPNTGAGMHFGNAVRLVRDVK